MGQMTNSNELCTTESCESGEWIEWDKRLSRTNETIESNERMLAKSSQHTIWVVSTSDIRYSWDHNCCSKVAQYSMSCSNSARPHTTPLSLSRTSHNHALEASSSIRGKITVHDTNMHSTSCVWPWLDTTLSLLDGGLSPCEHTHLQSLQSCQASRLKDAMGVAQWTFESRVSTEILLPTPPRDNHFYDRTRNLN